MDRSDILEDELKDYSYFQSKNKQNGHHIAENHNTPYPMIDLFYEMGDGHYPDSDKGYFSPPEQDEFADQMFQTCRIYAEGEDEYFFRDRFRNGWIERFRRAWASFVRDVQFAFLCSKYDVFDEQHYSTDMDKKQNTDLSGIKGGIQYRISLFIDSKKGRKNFKKKEKPQVQRREFRVEVPLSPKGHKKVVSTRSDDLWLYGREHIEGLKSTINQDIMKYTLSDEITKIQAYN